MAPSLSSTPDRSLRLRTVLRVLAGQIGCVFDLAEALASAAEAIGRHLAYERVAVYLVDPTSRDLALCATAGADLPQISPAHYHLAVGQGTPGQALQQAAYCRVDDFSTAAEMEPALDPAAAAELSVPIRDASRIVGVLTVASGRAGAFGPDDEADLALVADQVAAAIRSVELGRREADGAARERLLTHISHAVNSALTLDQVLQQSVAEVGERLKADRCVLSRIDLNGRFMLTEHEYINPMLTERRRLKGRRSLTGPLELLVRLHSSGQPVFSSEDCVNPLLRDEWPYLFKRYGIRSLVWMPILGRAQQNDAFYSLNLMQVTHPRHWTGDDVTLLRGIADQLALALHNAQLFEAVQKTAAELQANNAELEAFVYTVSHDLQAPVVTLNGFASLLSAQYGEQLDERGRMYVSRVAANAEFLSQLLHDLLELSRVGRLEEPDETVSAEAVVRRVLDDLAGPLGQSGALVTLPPVWPEVRYSSTRLAQVFTNLLSNAIKFLGSQPDPHVELGWRRLDGCTEFFVRDNGIGIPPAHHQRIFGPFQRLKQIEAEGTGVGLSIVKRIVEGRGGEARVESAPGAGATFYFTVPDAPPAAADDDGEADLESGLLAPETRLAEPVRDAIGS